MVGGASALVQAARDIPQTFSPALRWSYIRLIFNGWFLGRRMQKRRACCFCQKFDLDNGIEDSLEHLFHCKKIRQALGRWGADLDVRHFFLLEGSQMMRRGMAITVHALYRWHNYLRHTPWARFGRSGFWDTFREISHSVKFKHFVEFKAGRFLFS